MCRVPPAERREGDHSQGQKPAPAGCHRTCTSGGYSWSCAGSHQLRGEKGTIVRVRNQRPPAVIEPAHQEVIAGHVQGPTSRGREGYRSQGQIPEPSGCHRTCTSGGYSWSCAGFHMQRGEEGTIVRVRYQRPPAVIEPAHKEGISWSFAGSHQQRGEEWTVVRVRYQRPPAFIEPAHQEVIAGHVQGPTSREERRVP